MWMKVSYRTKQIETKITVQHSFLNEWQQWKILSADSKDIAWKPHPELINSGTEAAQHMRISSRLRR